MRIVSLLPAATEILFALGRGDEVVGVTFECDHPPEARERTVVSTSAMPEGLDPAGIDAWVSAAVGRGEDLYHLDEGALRGLDADLVVTQDLCAVCAVDAATVDDALTHLGCTAEVLTTDPHTLAEVLESITTISAATGTRTTARALLSDLRARLDAVTRKVSGSSRPRVLLLEWTDPPFAPGHWVPEQIAHAGAEPCLGAAGAESQRVTWDDVRRSAPDLVVCAPCGFDLDTSSDLARTVVEAGVLPAVPVWAVDANAEFARPGPRLVDGVETLAGILHPDSCPPGRSRRIR